MRRLRRFPTLALVLPLVALLLAAAPSAPRLGAVEAAFLNGRPARDGAPLAAGDHLATAAYGAAQVRWGEGEIQLGHKTSVAILAAALQLRHGYARVRAAGLREGPYRLEPAAAGEYEAVLLANGRAYLHVFTGAVALAGFGRPLTVSAGQAVSYWVPAARRPQAGGQEGGHKASDQPPANHTVVYVAVGAAAAAAVAAGLALGGSHASASPTQP